MPGKKFLGNPNQCSIVKSFDMYACKTQNWKFGSVLTTVYPADSRKTYCKVCNNAIINRFFVFNCCKKGQNNTENFSEWTSFGAVNTLQRQYRSNCTIRKCTIPFKMHHVLFSRAPASETYLFFLVKIAMQNDFHNIQVPCYCCVMWYETRTIFSLLYSHFRWSFCGVMLLHVARVWTGSFAVLVFLHSSILAFSGGAYHQAAALGPGNHKTSARPWTRPGLQIMMKVASQRFSTRAGFRPISPVLSKWFPDLKSALCKCWRRKRWSLYILNYCKQIWGVERAALYWPAPVGT